MIRRLAYGLIAALVVAAAVAYALTSKREQGYLGPVFSRDGAAVLAIVRDVRATVVGFGYDMWTPPADVWLRRDRFRLVRLRVSDGQMTTLQEFPPSPLEGAHLEAYHGAIFGEGRAHLRWEDPDHLEYEISVTRPDHPSSRTFVLRHRWHSDTASWVDEDWHEGSPGMGGDEPSQLAGPLEVLAPRGAEGLGCAVVILDSNAAVARALTDASACRTRFPDGLSPGALAQESRRADIERAETIRKTYEGLIAQGLGLGLSDGEAHLRAGKEMERLGWFPKSPTITATAAGCEGQSAVFTISDEEFRVGLFQDIEQAIANPGEEIDASVGRYVIHRDFDTSRRLNEYLADRSHTVFYVQGHGGCWRLAIDRHERRP